MKKKTKLILRINKTFKSGIETLKLEDKERVLVVELWLNEIYRKFCPQS